jgi:nucleoside-diphosphate-sugar epimerase
MSPAWPSPPVFVLGATSLIGEFLTRRLAQDGQAFTALSRRPPEDMDWLQADLADHDLKAKLPPLETVYSLSPVWLLPPALEAMHGAGMRRLVAFSSTSRFTKLESADPVERETARRLAEAEAQVQAFCEVNGIAWTILRPTLIYAEGRDGNISRLAGLIRKWGWLPISGRGEGLRQPVHADDLASAALAAAGSEVARNRTYDLAGGDRLTYRQMVERLFEGLNKPKLILTVPPLLWGLAFAVARPLLPGATGAMGARMSRDMVFDDAAARADFGWAPRPFLPQF